MRKRALRCSGLGLALLLQFLTQPSRVLACVVGTGTGASCAESALDACLPGGGSFDGTVTFDCGGAATITVTSTKTISADTRIDGGSLITVSGGHSVGVFSNSGVNFTVHNLTIANGHSASGGGIANSFGGTLTVTNSTFSGNSASLGGGIYNSSGTLTVANSTFSGNTKAYGLGGGIYNDIGTLTVTNSTFSGNSVYRIIFGEDTPTVANRTFFGNSASGISGGGIYNSSGTLTVTNSTLSGNRAGDNGGGIYNDSGTLTVTNSTFSGNSVQEGGSGGGIYNESGTVTVANTIVANSTSGGNCVGSVTDGGHNIDDGTTCGFTGTDCVTSTGSSFCITNAVLDSTGFQNNGGPTQTIALCTGAGAPSAGCTGASPAINAGDEGVCSTTTGTAPVDNLDQRGFVRPGTGAANCSIGAFEANSFGPTSPPTVELINPRSRGAVLTDSSGNIVLDFDKLGAAAALSSLLGNPTPGATADGVTRLLIRAWSDVSVTFQLPGGSADGCLATIAEPQSCGDSVTTQSHPVPSLGRSAAFALYITPTDFTAAATNQVTRQISLNVSNSGGATPSSFALWRPPILLVHGLWGTSGMWDDMQNRLDASFDAPLTIHRADYSGTSASALYANQGVLLGEIEEVVGALADQGIAAVQVDVVAKSMGGLISRLWTQDRVYRLARNYLQGDIHKLITLDTPHCGSFLASWVLPELSVEQPLWDSDQCGFGYLECPLIVAFYLLHMPIMYGAIPDLALNSPAIQGISLTNVPSHAIAGNAIPAVDLVDAPCFGDPSCEGIEAAVLLLKKTFGVNTVVANTSDLVVEVPSQLDHLSSEMATSQFPVIHIGPPYTSLPIVVENNGPVEDRVAALLQAPIAASQVFTELPAGAECSSAAESAAAITKTSGAQQVDGGVTIISPASGMHFEPGQIVHIEFQFGNGFSSATVLVLSQIGTQNPGTALTADLQIPAAFAGELPIGVLAIDASGQIADDFVSVVVAPSAAPTALVITPNPVVLNAVPLKVSQQLSVSGTMPDGTSVDLTTGVTGTTYSSSAPGVIGVGPNGRVTATSSGAATITVTYGTVSQPVQVTASNELDDEVAALVGDLNRDGRIDGADLNEVIHRLFAGVDADVNVDLTTSAPDVTAIDRLIGQQPSVSP